MPKKRGRKNTKNNKGQVAVKKALILKGDLEEYAQVEKMLGDRRLTINLIDGSKKLCIIPGRFKRGKRGMWINPGDIILISNRAFQDDRVDLIHRYDVKEVTRLRKLGDIPCSFLQDSVVSTDDKVDDLFSFEDIEESEEELDVDDI